MVCDEGTEGSCASSMLEIKHASVKKHESVQGMGDAGEKSGADLAAHLANWRAKFSTSTSYCYESGAIPDNCWASKPTTTRECTASSGTTTCKCSGESDNGCNIDLAGGATGRCAEILVYIGGSAAERHGSDVGVSGDSKEMFCQKMVLNDKWGRKGLLATTPERENKAQQWWGGWLCPAGYTAPWWGLFKDDKCHREQRFLGEKCWQAWGAEGTCAGSGTSHTEYSTACYQDTCVPYADVGVRNPCECSWLGANLLLVCSAKDDACNGHACVFSTGGGGGHYCDYATSQDWQTLVSR